MSYLADFPIHKIAKSISRPRWTVKKNERNFDPKNLPKGEFVTLVAFIIKVVTWPYCQNDDKSLMIFF